MKRRTFIRNSLAFGAALSAPSFFHRHAFGAEFRNNPGDSKSVVFGFNIPQTGAYAEEGADELRAYKLAVKHINGEGSGGMINTMAPLHLKGNGVLGKRVDYVLGDTETNSTAAVLSAKRLIEHKGALMVSGGSASDVAIAVQNLCHQSGIIFMVGLSHSNDTTGVHRKRYGFRHFFNAHMSAKALAPVMIDQMGNERTVAHITADYNWGWSQEKALRKTTDELGWKTAASVRTPVGAEDFKPYIEEILKSNADVYFFNHYGSDLSRSLIQASELGVRDKVINNRNVEIVAPLFSRLMAQGAGESIKGILGTTNWNWNLQDKGSQIFVRAFGQEYGFPPSQAAHTCYVQTLLYANACEMAGSFYPPEVIKALEDFKFDGMGNGPTLYRKEDHQCIKDVLVVRGSESPISQFDLLDVVKVVASRTVAYPPTKFGGELGPYKVS